MGQGTDDTPTAHDTVWDDGPKKQVDIQGPPPLSSGEFHPNEREVRQNDQKPVWMNEELLAKLKHTGGGSRGR